MKPKISICLGSSCFARGNERNLAVLEKFLADKGLKDEVDVDLEGSLCLGRCTEGPIVVIDGTTYTGVSGGLMLDLLQKRFNAKTGDAQ